MANDIRDTSVDDDVCGVHPTRNMSRESMSVSGQAPTAPTGISPSLRNALADSVPSRAPSPAPPVTLAPVGHEHAPRMVLELADKTELQGISFGAEGKSVSGECVFQTGMVLSLIHI